MKGDDLENLGPKTHDFYRIVRTDDCLIFTDELYESFEIGSPEYSTGDFPWFPPSQI